MYTIGEFSKINRISTKTLRHYDRLGLLSPAKTDEWTGYRYYRANQLERIRWILQMKELGFSLSDIGLMLKDSEKTDVLMKQRLEELKREISLSRRRAAKVLGYLERWRGEEFMENKVIIKTLPEVVAASMRTVVPGYDAFFEIVPQMGAYMESVGAVCREPAYCFTIYHDGEYKDHDIDVEICEAVEKSCRDSDKITFKTIPEVPEAACLMHKGPYETIGSSYSQLFAWVNENGYEPADNPRESYIDGIWNKEDPEEWLTEVQLPIKPAN
ncbi:MAG: MerR family transcriptional regulator [Spirochaetia bacterium]|nr:MerR family transcriptional regulator [Spirochaetia bacterium]